MSLQQIPGAPVSEEDYSLARSRSSPLSPRSSEQYHGLMDLMRKQHEVRSLPSPVSILKNRGAHLLNLKEGSDEMLFSKFDTFQNNCSVSYCFKLLSVFIPAHPFVLYLQKCMSYAQQFTQMGSVAEALK